MSKQVLILLAQGCEELEAVTISNILTRAGINVIRAGQNSHLIKCARGLTLLADTILEDIEHSQFDAVILPGGLPGANYLMNDARVAGLLNRHIDNNRLIGAICAAPKILVKNQLLLGKTITAFPGSLSEFDCSDYQMSDAAVEIDGQLITSRGPGTALDFALAIVDHLEGNAVQEMVEKALVR